MIQKKGFCLTACIKKKIKVMIRPMEWTKLYTHTHTHTNRIQSTENDTLVIMQLNHNLDNGKQQGYKRRNFWIT